MEIKKYVIAPKWCNTYLTEGKKYEIREVTGKDSFWIKSDNGRNLYCLYKCCSHLNGKDWIIPPTTTPHPQKNIDKLFNKIKRASDKYDKYLSACAKVAIEAQRHIDWDQDVGCCYAPGDGICIEIEAHLCPATRFFELMEFIGNDMIDEKTYLSNCI